MPPFLMVGARNLIAGILLFLAARLGGARPPARRQWGSSLLVGGLLITTGNGLVVYAERFVPSTTAALMIAMAPIWFAILAWIFRKESIPARGAVGIGIGFAGVVVLVGAPGTTAVLSRGVLALLAAALAWASGSVLAKSVDRPASPFLASGMDMMAGGALALLVSIILGEPGELVTSRISPTSWLAFGYLVVFGSLLGFTAYGWLIGAVSVARLSTYAYINPVVALVLGATLGGEVITVRVLVAAGIILCGVLLMTTARRPIQASALPDGGPPPRVPAPEVGNRIATTGAPLPAQSHCYSR